MSDDENGPSNDPARMQSALSVSIVTPLLADFLQGRSPTLTDKIFDELGEVLLFGNQIKEIRDILPERSSARDKFEDMLSSELVFRTVDVSSVRTLEISENWRVMILEADRESSCDWPIAALLRELSTSSRVFMAKVKQKGGKVLLSEDLVERAVARYLGVMVR